MESNYILFGIDFRSNEEQKELIRLINEDPTRRPVVFCKGAAGTGKTFAALAASLSLIRAKGSKKKYKNLYYVREPVEIGHRLGYLKGTEEDKYGPYLGGLLDNYNHLMEKARKNGEAPLSLKRPKKNIYGDDEELLPPSYQRLPNDIIPLAPEFLRGRSFEDSIILVDETQNMDINEIQTLVTRIGSCTKIIFLGSPNQIDVSGQSEDHNDFMIAYSLLKDTGLVGYVELTKPMRNSFVRDFDERFLAYKKTLKK